LALFVGIPAGILGAVLFASAEPWLRRVRPWQGVLFGLILLLATGFTFIDPLNFDFRRFGSAAINIAMFGGLLSRSRADRVALRSDPPCDRGGNGTPARVLEVVAFVAALRRHCAVGVVLSFRIGGLSDPALLVLFAGVAIAAGDVLGRGLTGGFAYADVSRSGSFLGRRARYPAQRSSRCWPSGPRRNPKREAILDPFALRV